jgi:hypothetical protein
MNQNDMPQAILAEQFGFVYKALYFVEYRDPNYPCKCPCHIPGNKILHCFPCCHDQSYSRVLRYSGVFRTPHAGKNYFLFTDPDPKNIDYPVFPPVHIDAFYEATMDVQRTHVLHREVFWCMLSHYTITLHRRAWDKLPKNRHSPVDLPIDFSGLTND